MKKGKNKIGKGMIPDSAKSSGPPMMGPKGMPMMNPKIKPAKAQMKKGK